jgi:hypothetical protein
MDNDLHTLVAFKAIRSLLHSGLVYCVVSKVDVGGLAGVVSAVSVRGLMGVRNPASVRGAVVDHPV